MRNLFLFAILCFAINLNCLNAQDAVYYDAVELAKTLDKGKFNFSDNPRFSSLTILKKYYHLTDSETTVSQYFKKNPFLKDFVPYGAGPNEKKLANIEIRDIAISDISGIDLTNMSDGMAQLLVERFKEEATFGFFTTMKADFEQYPELQTLYPKTYSALNYVNATNLYSMLPMLRGAYANDLKNILLHLPLLRYKSKYMNAMATIDGKAFGALALMYSGIQKGSSFPEIISLMANDRVFMKDSSNISAIIKYSNLLTQCFRDTTEGKAYISQNQFKYIVDNEIRLRIFMGLIYQKNSLNNIRFTRSGRDLFNLQKNLDVLALQSKLTASKCAEYLKHVYIKAVHAQNQFDSLKIKLNNRQALTASDYYNYSFSLFELNSTILQVGKGFDGAMLPDDVKDYGVLNTKMFDVYNQANSNRNGMAMLNVLQILDSTIFKNKQNADSREVIAKYGLFMANVADATTPNEYKLAINAAIAPPRSSATKQYLSFTVSVNAYVGLFMGSEYLYENKKYITTTGLYAPIGIGLYKSTPQIKNYIGYTGVFIPIVDFGALTSFRFKNDSVQRLPEMALQNIIAPGIYLTAGRLFNTPLAVGLGFEYGPQQRGVIVNGTQVYSAAWRWNITISYDIPLVYLYSKN